MVITIEGMILCLARSIPAFTPLIIKDGYCKGWSKWSKA